MTVARLEGARNLARNTRDRDRWTAEQWLRLYDAWKASGWDITPDEWTTWQVNACLAIGLVPQWSDDEGPIHPIHPFGVEAPATFKTIAVGGKVQTRDRDTLEVMVARHSVSPLAVEEEA